MKKIRVTEEGKQFEVFPKVIMTRRNDRGNRELVGLAYAGSQVASRAIHSALYNAAYLEVYDERTNQKDRVWPSSSSYRRIEHVEGKVTHTFAIPRSSDLDSYLEAVGKNAREDNPELPERIIMSWKEGEDLTVRVGHFLADTYGLPKSEDWIRSYMDALPDNKVEWIDVETTPIAGELGNLKAVLIKSMTEEEVLSYVDERIQSGLLSTRTADSNIEAHFEEDWSTEDYLRANTEQLVSKIDEHMKPLYDGKDLSRYVGETNRVSVPAQARATMGLLNILKEKRGAFLVGDMGTGKTQISLTTAYVKARKREESGAKHGMSALIIAPSNVLPKWAQSEIPTTLGKTCIVKPNDLEKIRSYSKPTTFLQREYTKSKIIATVINSTEDALKYINLVKKGYKVPKGKIHFVLISTDRMKLHAQGFILGAKWNPYRHEWISPNTGLPLKAPNTKKEDLDDDEIIATWSDVIHRPEEPPTLDQIELARENGTLDVNGIPNGYIKRWKNVRSFQDDYKAKKNNRSLARPGNKSLGETRYNSRWMIAELFQRMLPKHFHLGIFDEIHQMKAHGSGRGLAFHKILKSCRSSLFLTGTLTNGESSSIQAVLWRVFPRELLEHGFTHNTSAETWARRYGVIEQTRKIEEDSSEVGVTTNRRNAPIIKEKPGISPELTANLLLDKSIFLDLPDLNIPMITLEERPIVIELDDDHLEEYQHFHRKMYDTCMDLQQEMGTAAWSRFNPALLNYADQPTLGMNVEFIGREGIELGRVNAPTFPKDYETAKERKLIELVKERLENDRGIIIYTNYTQAYKTNQRLQKILNRHGIDPTILDEKVSVDKRFEWIEKQSEKGTKVIITNQRLVEVGLDLLDFPTIIFWQMNDNISTVRQSAKRAHRLGQNLHCEVLYLVNDKTQQMVQFQRLMSRRVAALLVEGAIEQSDELAQYAELSVAELTNDLSRSLATSEIVDAWEQAAQREMDGDLEMVSEEELQEKIKETFAILTQETKDLCGYVEPEIEEVVDNIEDEDSTVRVEQPTIDDIIQSTIDDSDEYRKKKDKDTKEKKYTGTEQLSLFDLVM